MYAYVPTNERNVEGEELDAGGGGRGRRGRTDPRVNPREARSGDPIADPAPSDPIAIRLHTCHNTHIRESRDRIKECAKPNHSCVMNITYKTCV